MEQRKKWTSFGWEGSLVLVGALAAGVFVAAGSCEGGSKTGAPSGTGGSIGINHVTSPTGPGGSVGSFAGDDVIATAAQSIANGRNTFRFDTFGDEAFWGDTLKLHEAIAGAANGGVGPGVSPKTALAVGLKVDAERGAGRRRAGRSRRAPSTSTIPRRRSRCSS